MANFDFDAFAQMMISEEGLHPSAAGSVFGDIHGVATHVGVIADSNGAQSLAVIVGSESEEAGNRIRDAWVGSSDPVKKGEIEVQPQGVAAKIPVGKAAKADFSELRRRITQLVATASSVVSGTTVQRHRARPALVNGVPMFLTEIEAGELELERTHAVAEYREIKPRTGRAVAFGLVGVAVASLVWGVLGAFADFSGWIVAIGAGLLIGFLVLRGAAKTSRGIQILIAGLALLTVFLGDLIGITIVISREFGVFDPAGVLDIYGQILQEDTGALMFTLGAGLAGAWFGSRLGRQPDLPTQVELAPA